MPLLSPSFTDGEREVLDAVRRHGRIGRSAITAQTRLAQQSVHRIVDDLIKRGLLLAGEPERGGRGQPSPRIELASTAAHAIGLSVNPDCAVVCLADMTCRVVEEVRLRVVPANMKQTLDDAQAALQRMIERNGVQVSSLVGLGVGMSGYMVGRAGEVNAPEPLRDWSLINLAEPLHAAFGLPLRMQNNATAAAVGELINGIGRRVRDFAYLSFNYGVGGGLIIRGEPLIGVYGNAGEIALCLTPEESERRPALRYLLEELAQRGVQVDSIEDLRLRFDPAWPGVGEWLERSMPQLNRIVSSLIAIADPQAIVFGGQLPPALGQMMIERVNHFERPQRYGVAPPGPELLLAQSNVDASAAGAAALVLREAFFR